MKYLLFAIVIVLFACNSEKQRRAAEINRQIEKLENDKNEIFSRNQPIFDSLKKINEIFDSLTKEENKELDLFEKKDHPPGTYERDLKNNKALNNIKAMNDSILNISEPLLEKSRPITDSINTIEQQIAAFKVLKKENELK